MLMNCGRKVGTLLEKIELPSRGRTRRGKSSKASPKNRGYRHPGAVAAIESWTPRRVQQHRDEQDKHLQYGVWIDS
jgi:hypothetical protein